MVILQVELVPKDAKKGSGVFIDKSKLDQILSMYKDNPKKLINQLLTELFGVEFLSKSSYTKLPEQASKAVIGKLLHLHCFKFH